MTRNVGDGASARSIFSNPTEEEKLYFKMIDRAVASCDTEIISNGRPAHAVYIICKFLEAAARRVNICTGRLRRTFGDVLAYQEPQLVQRAINFLQRGGELGILILDEPDVDLGRNVGEHPLLKALSDADIGDGRVNVYGFDERSDHLPDYHFVVMDGRAVRLEFEPDRAEAYVMLEDTEMGGLLDKAFRRRAEAGARLLTLPAT